LNNTISAEADVYKTFKDGIQLLPEDLNHYLFLDSLMDKTDAKILVGLQNSYVGLGGAANAPVPGNLRKLSESNAPLARIPMKGK